MNPSRILKTTQISPILTKGEITRAAILDAALLLAGRDGLEGLTIGLLAERMQMSKSGVFAHFGSREDLQVEVVREYHRRFEATVFLPALNEPRGLPRFEKMLSLWIKLRIDEVSTGCIYISGAVEFDDRVGAIRDQLVLSVQTWRHALERALKEAIKEGHLKKSCHCDSVLFQIYSFVLGLHHDARFLKLANSVELARSSIANLIQANLNTH